MRNTTSVILSLLIALTSFGQSWMTVSSGLNDVGRVLFNDTANNRLIVGGDFNASGGNLTPFIATWDGNTFGTIGGGFNAPVRAIAMYNGELYVGGDFTMAGNSNISYLAKWQGSSWVAVDTAVNGSVDFLKEHQGKLYISGVFDKIDTVQAATVIYNGNNFYSFSGTTSFENNLRNYRLRDVEPFNFKTYFAFETVGLVEHNGFSYLDVTTNQSSIVDYVNLIDIYALEAWDNKLYYAGKHHNGESSAYNLGYFDATNSRYAAAQSCGGFGYGMEGYPQSYINDIIGDANYLYAGGNFYEAGCPTPSKDTIFKFQEDVSVSHSNHLTNMETGTNGDVFDLEIYNNALYIVGDFTQAGSASSDFIARWDIPAPTANFSTINTNICEGENILFNNLSSSSATSFSWNFPGGTPSSSTLEYPNITYNTVGTYDVSLTASHSSGSNQVTQSNYITVNPNPTIPTISYLSGGFTSNATGMSNYQWYRDGQAIAGAGSPSYQAAENGTYTLEVTNTYGCKAVSNGITVMDTKIDENTNSELLTVFPNPTYDNINITINTIENYTVLLYNISNQLIYSEQNATQIDLSKMKSGVYTLIVKTTKGVTTQKIVKN